MRDEPESVPIAKTLTLYVTVVGDQDSVGEAMALMSVKIMAALVAVCATVDEDDVPNFMMKGLTLTVNNNA